MNSKDIAKIAGVSRSTVSRVVNNYKNVPAETRKHVLDVIEQYGYVPQSSARFLAGADSNIIGLFITDTKKKNDGHKVSLSSYFTPVIASVIDSANSYGFYVLAYTVSSEEDYKNVKKVFYDKTISGGIFIGQQSEQLIAELSEQGYKLALIDKNITKPDKTQLNHCIIVNADNFSGAYKATRYLIDLGHTRIAHITGYPNQLSSTERFEGYRKALTDAGLEVRPERIVRGDFTREGGYHATKILLSQNKPTAIFFGNDSMVIGGTQWMDESGICIPDDISVIGFDDIDLTSYYKPPITTVHIPLVEMSSIAVESLIKAIKSATTYSAQYTMPVELIKRSSCCKLIEKS